MKARFTPSGVSYRWYPFPGSSVHRWGAIPFTAIRDVDPEAAPPEIRTLAGETLFVPGGQRYEFATLAKDRSLPVVKRPDTWSLILEPFLDTAFTEEHHQQTILQLEAFGVNKNVVLTTREEVGNAMLAYNALLWDWCHLGLYDVLTAVRSSPSLTSLIHRFSRKRYTDFYWNAMKIADQGFRGTTSMAR